MQSVPVTQTQAQVQVNSFIRSVYNWMSIGLGITGIISYYIISNQQLMFYLRKNFILVVGLCIIELILVLSIVRKIQNMQASTATVLFLLYSALNGITLCVILYHYTLQSIASTFFICAGTFVACSIYGMVTKRDLTSIGQFLFMGFIGIFIASIVNLFIGSHGMQLIISYIGVIIFVGLTAYDTQKLKAMSLSQPVGIDVATVRKGSIMGALTLYLDFILMFQYLLFIFGGSRD
ncbi:MAG: Bax inhibitor-1/YccA family protein [Deltaproteobacteria bacterium]|nr:Bax inhibitor-1/YccA family protein [Deltaproteobacteria bacterium]